jgi:hypothetical protein
VTIDIVDLQVHIRAAESPSRPWPAGRGFWGTDLTRMPWGMGRGVCEWLGSPLAKA